MANWGLDHVLAFGVELVHEEQTSDIENLRVNIMLNVNVITIIEGA